MDRVLWGPSSEPTGGECSLRNHDNVLISGPTGTGKSYLACALGHGACRLVYNAHRITLKGASMRRAKSPTQHSDPLA